MGKSKFQISRSLDEKIRRIISGSSDIDSEFSLVPSAYILGFNYSNVTNCVGLTTNYQLHHAVFPVVGLAFFKSSPTDDEIKTDLSAIRDYSSSPNGLGSFKSDKNEHLFLIYSVDEQSKEVDKRIFNFSKGTFVRRKRHRLHILNDPFCPRNVYNGLEDVFNMGDGDSLSSADEDQVDHLIFFIHGVGGVCDVRFRPCVEVVADFKEMANTLLAQHSNPSSGASTPTANRQLATSLKKGFFRKQSTGSNATQDSETSDATASPTPRLRARKVECLPISWHSLTRRQTGFTEQLNQVSLSSVSKLRQFMNKVVMDAMLYSTGPVYTQTILNNVGNEINRLYTLFMERHPNFTGSVSLAGHSLGSVIVFDLLAHQIPHNDQPQAANKQSDNTNAASYTRATNESLSSKDQQNNSNHCNDITNNNNNNNGNNNNNNDDIPRQSTLMNTRQRCLNVAHNHQCAPMSSSNQRYCSDYRNLEELLKDMDLAQYGEMFHKEHIDLNSLLLLTDLDMKELRLPLGARRMLGTYINFKRTCRVPMAPADTAQESCKLNTQEQSHEEETSSDSELYCNPFGNMNTGQSLVQYPQLKFKPRCFFSFGSPTTMFLNVRGIQSISSEYKLPTCDRMLNIFHPYDPLAYRFEPMIDPRFKNVDPILIAHHRGGKRMHVQLREGFAKYGQDIKHRLLGSLRNTWASFTTLGGTSKATEQQDNTYATAAVDPSELNVKRQRLAKSSSSSGERESFETCASNPSFAQSSSTNATEPHRNPLRRQHELRRSQSEVTGGIGAGVIGASDLSSIIESSMSTNMDDEANVDPDAVVLNRLRSIRLDSGATTTTASSSFLNMTSVDTDDAGVDSANQKSVPPISDKLGEANEEEDEPISSLDFDHLRVGKLNRGRRIDYVLQEKPIELFNEYIFAFTSHANYWANEDSALIVLKEIYQVDGIHLTEHVDL